MRDLQGSASWWAARIAAALLEGGLQAELHDGGGDIAAGPLEDGSQGVGGAAHPAGDRVGEVDRGQVFVDVVHHRQQVLGDGGVTTSEAVEEVAPQLGGGLGEPVEPRRHSYAELVVAGEGRAVDEGRYEHGLAVLLLGVVEEPCVRDHGIPFKGSLGLPDGPLAVREERCVSVPIHPMHRPDGATGCTDRAARRGETCFACRLYSFELASGLADEGREIGPARGWAQVATLWKSKS